MAGRKSKLNREMIEQAGKLIAAGNFAKVVCQYLGIGESTYYRWLEEGEMAKGGLKREFWESIKKAESAAEMRAVTGILQAGEENWTAYAWFLERKYPDRWGKKEKHEIMGKDGNAIEIQDGMRERLLDEIRKIKESRSG